MRMRLIDADKASMYLNTEACKQIQQMPTVDAIPIGWIEEQIRESYDSSKEYDGCYDCAWALSELVKRWRVENGSVD